MSSHPRGFFEGTEMPNAGWWEALWPDPAGVLAAVGVRTGMDVIDLCSGDGWFTMQLAKIAGRVTAVDIDPALLDVARHRLAQSGAANCDFAAGNAYELTKLVPRSTDFVFLANAFHGVQDQPKLASAVRSALKPGGRFAIVNWHPRPREETTVLGEPRGPRTELRMSPEQTAHSVKAGGLNFQHVVEIPPYHYGSVFVRER